MRTVLQSAEALLRLLNDILDFSKVEAGKLELETIPFDLRDSVGDTIQTLSVRAAQKGLELAYHIPADVPDRLLGDPGRLAQVLVNLVGNAIKFTEKGEVVVTVQVVGGEAIGCRATPLTCNSPLPTPAWASPPKSRVCFSLHSAKPIRPRRGVLAAPG